MYQRHFSKVDRLSGVEQSFTINIAFFENQNERFCDTQTKENNLLRFSVYAIEICAHFIHLKRSAVAKKCYRINHRWNSYTRLVSICVYRECQRVVLRCVGEKEKDSGLVGRVGKRNVEKVKREKLRPTRETFLEMKYEQK